MSERIGIATLNSMPQAEFVATVGFVFEDSAWIAAHVWSQRPFASVEQLHAAMCAVVQAAPRAQQIALIQAHPDLAGRAAQQGTLGVASTDEQAAAGLATLTDAERAEFTRLNTAYKARFGFPFVICARENQKASILASFHARLPNAREAEITTALHEIYKIAGLRLADTVTDQPAQTELSSE